VCETSPTTLYSVGFSWNPHHEAVIRFFGEAPRRRAHSSIGIVGHGPTRVTATSNRKSAATCELTVCAEILLSVRGVSDGRTQRDTDWRFASGDHSPQRDKQLAGQRHNHGCLACSLLGPLEEPAREDAVFLEHQETPSELDPLAREHFVIL
jgi:hypothetical protein